MPVGNAGEGHEAIVSIHPQQAPSIANTRRVVDEEALKSPWFLGTATDKVLILTKT